MQFYRAACCCWYKMAGVSVSEGKIAVQLFQNHNHLHLSCCCFTVNPIKKKKSFRDIAAVVVLPVSCMLENS